MYKNIRYILKQDGMYEDYDISKLQSTIKTALQKVNEYNEHEQFLIISAKKIAQTISDKINVELEDDQLEIDYVRSGTLVIDICDELFNSGYTRAAQTYIVNKYIESLNEKDKIITKLKKELTMYREGVNNATVNTRTETDAN